MSVVNKPDHYDGSDIQVLEGLEAVRKRPGMYIGSTGPRGLHHLVYEVVDNAVDEALAGYCDSIEVWIHPDNSITVADNGRGIPVDMHPKEKIPTVEVVLTILHAGGKFGGEGYKVSGGLHGVGVSVVNALSSRVEVNVRRDGKEYEIDFDHGHTKTKLHEIGTADHTGTKVTFWPDPEIFAETTVYDYDTLAARFREMAFLNKGLKITMHDERENPSEVVSEKASEPRTEVFQFMGGIIDFVKYLNKGKETLNEPIYFSAENADGTVEVAMQWSTSYSTNSVMAFANNINTHEGGTHLDGFKQAVTRTINDYARSKSILKEKDSNLSGDDTREGLAAIISVKLHDPQFEGQTKGRLGNSEVRPAVEGIITQQLTDWLENLKNQEIAQQIVQKAIRAAQVREAARKTRDNARKANQLDAAPLVGKLSACRGKKAEDNELFIVEGDSAGGSAKQGRDSRYQAILPLRGKPLNAEKKRLDQVLSNEEFRSLITALGTSIDENFNLANLKYNKVIILSDADQDGAHIRAILLTFFFRYMKELVTGGHVYIGMPPLYKVQKGSKVLYAYDDKELAKCIKEAGKGYTLQRYKGLGEMNPEQLWATTMDPSQRKLMQVTIEDAALADRRITILMGDKVEPRRDYIIENADFNKPDNFELPEGQRGEGK